MNATNRIIILCLVMRVCWTTGILTTKLPRDSQSVASLQSPQHSYLPTSTFPKLPQRPAYHSRTSSNGLEDAKSPGSLQIQGQTHTGYAYLKPPSIQLHLPSNDRKIESVADLRRSPEVAHDVVDGSTTRTVGTTRTSTSRPRTEVEYHPQVPGRSSYQVVEELDEYLTDDSDHGVLPHRGKAQTTYPHRDSQDITTAIKALDHFLSGVLNDDSYNSALHPPPNPVLALVLSRYGRYVPGARNPRVYAYMAVNNIHNNQPFGKYKVEYEDEPTYAKR